MVLNVQQERSGAPEARVEAVVEVSKEEECYEAKVIVQKVLSTKTTEGNGTVTVAQDVEPESSLDEVVKPRFLCVTPDFRHIKPMNKQWQE